MVTRGNFHSGKYARRHSNDDRVQLETSLEVILPTRGHQLHVLDAPAERRRAGQHRRLLLGRVVQFLVEAT